MLGDEIIITAYENENASQGKVFVNTMTQHDPIRCEEASGIFQEAACARKLKIDYRCTEVIDPTIPKLLGFTGSFYVISKTD